MNQNRIEFANTLRGLAAIFVVISHYFGVFWYNPAAVAALIKSSPLEFVGVPLYVEWLQIHPYFNWGAFGVAVFFIISGFVIPASLGKLSGNVFLGNRVVRIMPTYVVGFTICLLAIAYNINTAGGTWPFSTSHVLVHFLPGLRDVLGTTNIDGIIWTLEIEVKFYLVCALIAPLFKRRSLWIFAAPAILAVLVAIASSIWKPGFDLVAGRLLFSAQYIVFMFAGVAFYYAHVGAIAERIGLLLAAALIAVFVLLWRINSVGIPIFLAWNYVLAFALFWFAFAFPKFFRANPITNFFADISYPLYVVHGVAGYTLLAALREAGMRASVSLLITTASALAVSYVVHILVEKPSQVLSKRRSPVGLSPAK